MLGELLGAVVGREIDKSDGEGGTAGAVLGVAGWAVLKRVVPLALIGVGILVAGRAIRNWGES